MRFLPRNVLFGLVGARGANSQLSRSAFMVRWLAVGPGIGTLRDSKAADQNGENKRGKEYIQNEAAKTLVAFRVQTSSIGRFEDECPPPAAAVACKILVPDALANQTNVFITSSIPRSRLHVFPCAINCRIWLLRKSIGSLTN